MSKLLKSKILFGLMAVALVVAGAVAFAPVVSAQTTQVYASEFNYSGVMKVGMSGPGISTLQAALNTVNAGTIIVDGKFGPATAEAVKKFQMSKGLVVDGIVGPSTGTALALATKSIVIVPVGLPEGCTSAEGYSSVTGKSCAVVTTYPAGCTSTSGYSPTTGVKCDSTSSVSLPAGCTSTSGYSVTTGNKCDGDSSSTSNGSLEGGAGTINITTTSSDTENEVIEGATEKVLAFRVEAEGSDVSLSNLKVSIERTGGAGSSRIERHIDEVMILNEDGDELGSANADDFSKSGIVYSKNIALDNAVVKEGKSNRATFYIAIKALSNIDSADMNGDVWKVTASDLRYEDATGVVMTEGTVHNITNLSFTDLATSGDVKLYVSKGSASPTVGNVEVSDTGSTSDVLLNEFKLKASGSDMTVTSVTVKSLATGASGTEIASQYTLEADGEQIADITSIAGAGGAPTNNTFTLYDDLMIDKGDTVTFKVFAKINKIAVGAFTQGDSLKVDYVSAVIEDENGSSVTSISGSANGETQYFYSEGLTVDVKSAKTTVTSEDGFADTVQFAWTLDITAFGDKDVYINRDVADIVLDANKADGDVDLIYIIDQTGTALAGVSGTITSTDSDVTNVTGAGGFTGAVYNAEEFFKIAAGSTGTFTINIAGTNSTDAKQMRARLMGLEWTTDAVENAAVANTVAPAINVYTSNLPDDSATPYQFVS